MPQGWRPTHPGEPTPEWGPGGRTGCIVFVTVVVIAILAIALLIGAVGISREARSADLEIPVQDAVWVLGARVRPVAP